MHVHSLEKVMRERETNLGAHPVLTMMIIRMKLVDDLIKITETMIEASDFPFACLQVSTRDSQ